MIRRTFLKSLIPLFLFIVGCVQRINYKNNEKSVNSKNIKNLYDNCLDAYNRGDLETVMNFFERNCTFISDNIDGDYIKLKKMLGVMYRRQNKQGRLPINYSIKASKHSEQMNLFVLKLSDNKVSNPTGYLTIVSKKSNQDYKIIHYHFSS